MGGILQDFAYTMSWIIFPPICDPIFISVLIFSKFSRAFPRAHNTIAFSIYNLVVKSYFIGQEEYWCTSSHKQNTYGAKRTQLKVKGTKVPRISFHFMFIVNHKHKYTYQILEQVTAIDCINLKWRYSISLS